MSVRKNPFFQDFEEAELTAIENITQAIHLKNGQNLFVEGVASDGFFILEQGFIRIYKTTEGGEKSLARLEPGSTIGEMTLLEDDLRTASAKAEGSASLLKVEKEGFKRLMLESPKAAIKIYISFLKVLSSRLKRTSQELVVLYEIGKLISESPGYNDLLNGILKCVMGILNVKTAAFAFINDISGKLEFAEALGPGAERLAGLKLGLQDGLVGLALKQNRPLKIDYLDADPEFRDVPRFGFETQSMIVLPLVKGPKTFGAMLFCDKNDLFPFDPADLHVLIAVSDQAAAAVEAALQQKDKAARELHDRHYFRF